MIRRVYRKFRRSNYYFPLMKKSYTIMRHCLPINKKLIVFESNVGKSIGDSPKDIYDELQKRDLDYKYVWISNNPKCLLGKNTKRVNRLSMKYYYYLARAGYWVNNQNFPTYLIKPKGTTYLQTWHGTPLKRMQNDIETIIGRDSTYLERVNFAVKQWDYLVSPSSYASGCFKTAFQFDKEIIEVGYPRNDIFYKPLNERRALGLYGKDKLNLLNDDRKIILYAPTFRDDSLSKFNLALDFQLFSEKLSQDYVLLVRGHVATGQKISIPSQYKNDIIDVSNYPNIQELYLISDICVTDYSSVMFDYAHTKRPLIFFTYDLEHYQENLRGFYMDFVNEAPGKLVKTTEDLITAIRETENFEIDAAYEAFYKKYCLLEDGTSAIQVVDKVFGKSTQKITPDYLDANVRKSLEKIKKRQTLNLSINGDNLSVALNPSLAPIALACKNDKYGQYDVVNQVVLIPLKDIADVISQTNSDLVLVDKDSDPIEFDSVVGQELLSFISEGFKGYVYLTGLRKLSFTDEAPVKMNGYYLKNKVISYGFNEGGITLELDVHTRYVPCGKITASIENYRTGHGIVSEGECIGIQEKDRQTYVGTYQFKFDMALIGKLMSMEDLTLFEAPVFNLICEIDFLNDGVFSHRFNINAPDRLNEELLISGVNESTVFKFYGDTNVQFLRMRLVKIPNEYVTKVSRLSQEKNMRNDLFFDQLLSYLVDENLEVAKQTNVVISSSSKGFELSVDADYGELFLEYKARKIPFMRADTGYFLPYSHIRRLLGVRGGTGRIVTETNRMIHIDKFVNLKYDGPSYHKGLINKYFIYNSIKNNLRIGMNQLIPAKSYLINQRTTGIEAQGDQLKVYLTIKTLASPITGIYSKIKLRDNPQEVISKGLIIQVKDLANGTYLNYVELSFSAEDIYSCTREKERKMYSFDIFDFSFRIDMSEHLLKEQFLRINAADFPSETAAVTMGQEKLVMYLYPTSGKEMLSAKLSYIEADVYEFYNAYDATEKNIQDKQPVVLVTEYPHKAQDTGLAYFKYLVDKHPEIKTYYMVSSISNDLVNLQGYEDRVVFYKTKEHAQIFIESDIIASSHGTNYAAPIVDNYSKQLLSKKFKVFLQHGMLGVRDMSYLYGKDEQDPFTNLFITSSEREKQLVVNDFGYDDSEVIVSGLSRFDVLFERESVSLWTGKKIIIMPSWREGLNKQSSKVFMESDFYQVFQSLLNNEAFEKLVAENNWEVSFYLHTNFQQFSSCFSSNFVKIINEGEKTVQSFLMESDLLITDYSSVGLDFAIMEKPIIYYQFDKQIKNLNSHLKLDFFPGEIKNSEKELLEELIYFNQNPKMRTEHLAKLDNLYKYRDTHANDRIFDQMMKMYNEKKCSELF